MILAKSNAACARTQDLAGTFAGLMDLYERNYIGIRRLVPTIPPANTLHTSHVRKGLQLHLHVVERFAYTSELTLTYHFRKTGQLVTQPDLRIRVYHDARLAEVMSAHMRHWPPRDMDRLDDRYAAELNQRWRINRFLFKWLNYCLYQGHRFTCQNSVETAEE